MKSNKNSHTKRQGIEYTNIFYEPNLFTLKWVNLFKVKILWLFIKMWTVNIVLLNFMFCNLNCLQVSSQCLNIDNNEFSYKKMVSFTLYILINFWIFKSSKNTIININCNQKTKIKEYSFKTNLNDMLVHYLNKIDNFISI